MKMTKFKKAVSALLIAGTLTLAQSATSQAGIIFLPAGLGVILLVFGLAYHDPLLIVLDANGNLSQDQLEQVLAKKYPVIEDREVIHNLATAIRDKAASTQADQDGRKTVTLDREQVLNILAPTGLADMDPAAANQIVADLQ